MKLELINNDKINTDEAFHKTYGLLCQDFDDYKYKKELGKYTTTAKFIEFLYKNNLYNNIYHYCRNTYKDCEEDIIYKDLFIRAGKNKECKLEDSIKTIGVFAFKLYRLEIKTVILNDGLEKISHRAFEGCVYLQKIIYSKQLLKNIKNVSWFAFFNCNPSIMRKTDNIFYDVMERCKY